MPFSAEEQAHFMRWYTMMLLFKKEKKSISNNSLKLVFLKESKITQPSKHEVY